MVMSSGGGGGDGLRVFFFWGGGGFRIITGHPIRVVTIKENP